MTAVKRFRSILFITITAGMASTVSMIGGIGLEAVLDKLLPLVPLIVAMPGLNDLVGDYATIIAAHAADPAERKTSKRELARAIAMVVGINIVGIIALSLIIASRQGYVFEPGFMAKFGGFVAVSIITVVVSMFTVTAVLDKVLERRRINPDDLLIPVVTSVADVMMLGLIALAAWTLF